MDGDFKRPLGTNNTGVPAPATTSGFEGSPETYENAEGAPVEAVKEPQEMKEKKPGKFKKFMLRFLLLLAVLGLAAAAGWFWYDGQGAKNELTSTKSQLTTAEAAQKTAEAKVKSLEAAQTKTAASKTDVQLVTDAVTKYLHAYKDYEKSPITVNTQNVKDGKTIVEVSYTAKSPDGGAGCIVKKVDGDWVVIDCGQGAPDAATMTKFGIPATL